MNIDAHIDKLRKKPARVRTKILFIALCSALVILVGVWILTFHVTHPGETVQFIRDVGTGFTKTFDNPTYKNTFDMPHAAAPNQ